MELFDLAYRRVYVVNVLSILLTSFSQYLFYRSGINNLDLLA